MTKSRKSHRVAIGLQGERLDQALVIAGLCTTRSQAQIHIKSGKVQVNTKTLKSSYKVQDGDLITMDIDEPTSLELEPYNYPIEVVFEDQDLIVINKPAGLVVHPAHGHKQDTLINALLYRQTQLAPNNQEPFRPGLVHRIDKGTSGLLVLAKNQESHSHLAKQFLKKTIHRRYWALCFSNKPMDEGRLESYIMRDPNHRQRFASVETPEKGKKAITHYKCLKTRPPFSLYELRLETGRTHQIRVHLSFEKNPIVADDLYGGKNQAKGLKNQNLKNHILAMDRFALHAKELGFVHPRSRKTMHFTSPLPEDLKTLFDLAGFSDEFK